MRLVLGLAASAALMGCATSFTVPAAVRTTKGEMFYGSTTASTTGGHFEVNEMNGRARCSGTYDPWDNRRTISSSFTCTDGRSGTITVTRRTDGVGGTGSVRMNDGTTGFAAFGADASTITASEPAGSPTSDPPKRSLAAAAPPAPDRYERAKAIVTSWVQCANNAAASIYTSTASATEIANGALGLCITKENEYRKFLISDGAPDVQDLVVGAREDIGRVVVAKVLKARKEVERDFRQAPPTQSKPKYDQI